VTENGIPTTFPIGGKVLQRIRYGEEQDDWEQIDSLVTTAASAKARSTSSVATWSDALSAADRRFIVSAHTIIGLLTSHAKRPNQSLEPTAGRRDVLTFTRLQHPHCSSHSLSSSVENCGLERLFTFRRLAST
jgi:hypothetical protein